MLLRLSIRLTLMRIRMSLAAEAPKSVWWASSARVCKAANRFRDSLIQVDYLKCWMMQTGMVEEGDNSSCKFYLRNDFQSWIITTAKSTTGIHLNPLASTSISSAVHWTKLSTTRPQSTKPAQTATPSLTTPQSCGDTRPISTSKDKANALAIKRDLVASRAMAVREQPHKLPWKS